MIPNALLPISLTQPCTIWTPEQWISAWQSKVDVAAPVLNGVISGNALPNLFASPPPIGSSAPNAGSFTNLTLRNALTLDGNRPWSGVNLTQTLINSGMNGLTFTGTIANTGGYVGLGIHFNIGTIMDAHANVGNVAVSNFNGQYFSGAQGGMSGVIGIVTIPTGQTLADKVPREFAGGRDFATAASSSNGQLHSIMGRTTVAQILAGGTGYGQLVGHEIAISAAVAVPQKVNQYLMLYAADVARGSSGDRMLGFWSQNPQNGANNSKVIIDIGPQGQSHLYFPGGTDATLIQASKGAGDGDITVANLLDFASITAVTGNNINMPNFTVSGGGTVKANGFQAFGDGNAAINLVGAGTGGAEVSSSDGILLQVANQNPGSGITTNLRIEAGQPSVIITVSGSAANNSVFINSNGASSAVGFQPGAPAQIDINGNITAPSIGNGAAALRVSGAGSWTENGTTAVSLTALAPAGAHGTVQEWLTFKDASGTTRYIPAF